MADQRALEWVSGPDTGISSIAIWRHIMGLPRVGLLDWPRDADDFARCRLLLDMMPEWCALEMAQYGPEWARCARELEDLSDDAGA